MDFTIDSIGSLKICQPKEGYRFSVDAILLAKFVNLKKAKKILDIGAGTGIVGLILAKKYPTAEVKMIEIQTELAKLAEQNIRMNEIKNKIEVICIDAKAFNETGYDIIVSNPPFRKANSGKLSPWGEKALARHELSLTVKDIACIAQRTLRNRGRLYIVHLPERLTEIIKILGNHRLEVKRLRFVHSRKNTEAKMVLLEAVKEGKVSLKVERPLFIYEEDGAYTEEMEEIYKI
ncbi:tRNA1(Val) (adenine(37)-N6)-methyltransferase [Thermodesulfovibrio sp.]|uniref:tRNA1(Val) (adenine(37)-N6)-methyltransferase n=1 Tax=Thermodesulfovibrio sp. TaxID=2067987 RepID=UPI0030B7CFB7